MQTKDGGQKWLENMVKKHGSPEAVSEEMRKRASKSKRNLGKSGGFGSMDEDAHIEASRKGGLKGKRGRTEQVD